MASSPSLPFGYDPARVLVGDIDGDGAADMVYVGAGQVTLWINRSGNSWSEPGHHRRHAPASPTPT